MKYSLRSLIMVVLVVPPLLAWVALPLHRWLTTPKVPEPTAIIRTRSIAQCSSTARNFY
jgi:hypothetical protein